MGIRLYSASIEPEMSGRNCSSLVSSFQLTTCLCICIPHLLRPRLHIPSPARRTVTRTTCKNAEMSSTLSDSAIHALAGSVGGCVSMVSLSGFVEQLIAF